MKTKELKKICSTIRGIIKSNKIRPITDFVEIYSKDGIAHLGATDNRTTIVATLENENDIDNVVISLPDLYKLVKLTTKEDIVLTNKGRYVEFKGNGKYKIPIQTDEMGNDLYLPLEMPEMGDIVEYDSKDFQLAQERNKIGLFAGDSHDEFKLYYHRDYDLITCDSIVVACTNIANLPSGDVQPFVIDQLATLEGVMKFSEVDGGYRISYNNYEIYMVNKLYSTFPIKLVEPFLVGDDTDRFPIKVTVDKEPLLAAINRQDIFRTPYDTPSIIFDMDYKGITLRNKNNTVEEPLELIDQNNLNPIVNRFSTSILVNILKNMKSPIDLYIGNHIMRITDTQGFYVIAGMTEEKE